MPKPNIETSNTVLVTKMYEKMQNFASTNSYVESIRRELSKSGLGMFLRPLVMILCYFLCLSKTAKKRGGPKKNVKFCLGRSKTPIYKQKDNINDFVYFIFRNGCTPSQTFFQEEVHPSLNLERGAPLSKYYKLFCLGRSKTPIYKQ